MSTLLLFSGGLDSMTLAHEAHAVSQLAGTLHIRYGAPAEAREVQAVREWHRRRWAEGRDVRAWDMVAPLRTEPMRLGSGVEGPRVLPGRNLVFLSLAVALAAQEGIDRVWYGAQGGDDAEDPDCRPAFVAAVAALSAPWGVTVEAPLMSESKAGVIRRALAAGVDLDLAWSCYQPAGYAPCGGCGACVSRRAAEAA